MIIKLKGIINAQIQLANFKPKSYTKRANQLYTFLQNTNVLIQLVSLLWKNVVYSKKCQNKSK